MIKKKEDNMPGTVFLEHKNDISIITLNRPKKLNAINRDLTRELLHSLKSTNQNDDCKVIIIKGSGSSFCAGDDLEELADSNADLAEAEKSVTALQDITREIMFSNKFVITLVQGWGIGAGFSWILNSDAVFWANDAKCLMPEAKYGLYPTGAATYLLPNLVGRFRASKILLEDKEIKASELMDLGFGTEILNADELNEASLEYAEQLYKKPFNTLATYKKGLIAPSKSQIEAALDFETKMCIEAYLKIQSQNNRSSTIDSFFNRETA